MKLLKWFGYVFIVVLVVNGLFRYWNMQDLKASEAAAKYTSCVKATYHITPQAYLAQNGRYPDCD